MKLFYINKSVQLKIDSDNFRQSFIQGDETS